MDPKGRLSSQIHFLVPLGVDLKADYIASTHVINCIKT